MTTSEQHLNYNLRMRKIQQVRFHQFSTYKKCPQAQRAIFEQYSVFSPTMIDGIIRQLESYNNFTLRGDLQEKPEEVLDLVRRYFHCG